MYRASAGQQQPTLTLLGHFLNSLTTALERTAEENYLLLNKVKFMIKKKERKTLLFLYVCVQFHDGNHMVY